MIQLTNPTFRFKGSEVVKWKAQVRILFQTGMVKGLGTMGFDQAAHIAISGYPSIRGVSAFDMVIKRFLVGEHKAGAGGQGEPAL